MINKISDTNVEFYTICGPAKGPHLLIISGIHGDEFEPMITAVNLIRSFENKLINGKVTILPVANKSAYDLGKRCGADQLDLARTMPGKKNGTITEKVAQSISKLIQQADYLIDLHTGGALFDILPLTGYMLHPDKKILKLQQEMAKSFNLPVIWGTDALAQGRTLSEARDYNIPAIYAECRGGLKSNKASIRLYEKGCENVMENLGLIPPQKKAKKTEFKWLEDYRSGQGNLQIKLPSPDNGIFIPFTSIGKSVKKGTLLGYIVNPITLKKTKIINTENGVLFMLRISSRVNAGDSLGGILPILGKTKKVIHAK